jgi:hypothetical protein
MRQIIQMAALMATVAMSGATAAADRLAELNAKNEASMQLPGGRDYEEQVALDLMKSPPVQQCMNERLAGMAVPAGSKAMKPGPLVLFFEIAQDGKLTSVESLPESNVGSCIMGRAQQLEFSPPPGDFVVKIDLSFVGRKQRSPGGE